MPPPRPKECSPPKARWMMRLHQPDMIEEKLVAPGVPSCAFLKSSRISGAVRLLLSVSTSTMRAPLCRAYPSLCGAYPSKTTCSSVSLSLPMPAPFLVARSITSRHRGAPRVFDHSEEARVPVRLGSAELRGDHDSFDESADHLAFLNTATSRLAWNLWRPRGFEKVEVERRLSAHRASSAPPFATPHWSGS